MLLLAFFNFLGQKNETGKISDTINVMKLLEYIS
jgi:hypothetical protein